MTSQDKKPKQKTPLEEEFLQSSPVQAGFALRKKAIDKLRRTAYSPEDIESFTPEEVRQKLYELQVYQIELEMQNEELRQAQKELEISKVRYFDIYNLAPVGYCTLDKAGLIIEANLTLTTLLGITKSALVKQTFGCYIHKEDQDTYYLHRKQLFETGEPQLFELRMLANDGNSHWVRLDANLLKDEQGAPLCLIVLTNITGRKRIEEENKRLEAQYRQAQKMESVGRLAGGVAHDFNNKLTIILGYSEMIREKLDPADSILADLHEIRLAANHSADLSRQLLAFSRQQIIMPKVLDLNVTVDRMLNMLRRIIGENISLAWLPKMNLWLVNIDPTQLNEIIANLCVNARDAIAGSGKLTIATYNIILDEDYCTDHVGSVPGEYVVLTVSDNGCGMDEETMSKIFEPFFTTKPLGEGTGLGLATVYGVVKQNNGYISVSSEPDQGTIFKIYLPRHVGKILEVPVGGAVEQAQRGMETILLVEDELAILEMTSIILEKLGYRVLAANTPSRALQLANEFAGKINLILTDVIMPEMTGSELAQEIDSFDPNIKILFMSGYTSNFIAQQGKLGDNVHFIQKPFAVNELATKVRQALGDKKENL
jgi:PAS domain S-box-containing protein